MFKFNNYPFPRIFCTFYINFIFNITFFQKEISYHNCSLCCARFNFHTCCHVWVSLVQGEFYVTLEVKCTSSIFLGLFVKLLLVTKWCWLLIYYSHWHKLIIQGKTLGFIKSCQNLINLKF